MNRVICERADVAKLIGARVGYFIRSYLKTSETRKRLRTLANNVASLRARRLRTLFDVPRTTRAAERKRSDSDTKLEIGTMVSVKGNIIMRLRAQSSNSDAILRVFL